MKRLTVHAARAALLLSVCTLAHAGTRSTLKKVTLTRADGKTDVVLQFSNTPVFHDFALGDPPRAVLDMRDTRNGWRGNSLDGGAVKAVRLARNQHGRLRAVLDLRHGGHLSNVSRRGNTLIIHITGGSTDKTAVGASHPDQTISTGASHGQLYRARYRVARANRPIVVVIDPGHGGSDPGTSGPNGLHEKAVTLSIGKMLFDKLEKTPGIHPVLTRSRDHYVTLSDRVSIAQKRHADVFVSIHANASPGHPKVTGGTCYELSQHGASSAEAAQLEHFENSRDRDIAGVHFSSHNHTLNTILTQLFQNQSIEAAHSLANSIIGEFAQVEPIYKRKPPRANFAVLRNPMVASVLCEIAFLSNPAQARQLRTHAFRKQLANAIYLGIVQYLRNNPPMHAEPDQHNIYVVRTGDTLSGIAAANGLSAKQLAAANHLRSTQLRIGQTLKLATTASSAAVPKPAALQNYKVQPGDTLSQIAVRHGVSTSLLETLNDMQSSTIRAGEMLSLPSTDHDGAS
ncbi:MAG: N-acetylmuramoyl-L-alanine amidase [Salinisphaera sp.]|nr:N-acetylmuramoyl-L-alanine amidase [Salinisphaera sp.]